MKNVKHIQMFIFLDISEIHNIEEHLTEHVQFNLHGKMHVFFFE